MRSGDSIPLLVCHYPHHSFLSRFLYLEVDKPHQTFTLRNSAVRTLNQHRARHYYEKQVISMSRFPPTLGNTGQGFLLPVMHPLSQRRLQASRLRTGQNRLGVSAGYQKYQISHKSEARLRGDPSLLGRPVPGRKWERGNKLEGKNQSCVWLPGLVRTRDVSGVLLFQMFHFVS